MPASTASPANQIHRPFLARKAEQIVHTIATRSPLYRGQPPALRRRRSLRVEGVQFLS
jgi:hypothetical protein